MVNSVDADTTRRVSVGLLTVSGALLLAALGLVGAGVSGADQAYAARVSSCLQPLAFSGLFSMIGFVCAEIAADSRTPTTGHPHSVPNYLQTAFALVLVGGVGFLLYGGFWLMVAASVPAP